MTKKYFESVSSAGMRKAGFIAPLRTSGKLSFVSIRTGEVVTQFIAVFTGINLSPEMVLSKMVDAGLVIEDVDQTLADLEQLLQVSASSKLGFVYEQSDVGNEFEFRSLGKLRSA